MTEKVKISTNFKPKNEWPNGPWVAWKRRGKWVDLVPTKNHWFAQKIYISLVQSKITRSSEKSLGVGALSCLVQKCSRCKVVAVLEVPPFFFTTSRTSQISRLVASCAELFAHDTHNPRFNTFMKQSFNQMANMLHLSIPS